MGFVASDSRAYINILAGNAAIALSDDAVLKTGSHCRYCPARHRCEPAIHAGIELFEVSARPILIDLTAHEMGLQ